MFRSNLRVFLVCVCLFVGKALSSDWQDGSLIMRLFFQETISSDVDGEHTVAKETDVMFVNNQYPAQSEEEEDQEQEQQAQGVFVGNSKINNNEIKYIGMDVFAHAQRAQHYLSNQFGISLTRKETRLVMSDNLVKFGIIAGSVHDKEWSHKIVQQITHYIIETAPGNVNKNGKVKTEKRRAIKHVDARVIATMIVNKTWKELEMIENEFLKMDENNQERDFEKAIENLEKEHSSSFKIITKICHQLPLYTKYFS